MPVLMCSRGYRLGRKESVTDAFAWRRLDIGGWKWDKAVSVDAIAAPPPVAASTVGTKDGDATALEGSIWSGVENQKVMCLLLLSKNVCKTETVGGLGWFK